MIISLPDMDNHPSVDRILNFPRIQQRSPEWFEYRCKRVTASEASVVIAQGKGAKSLMHRKKMGGLSCFSNVYTQIGTDNEEIIAEKYQELYPDVKVYHDLSIIPHKKCSFVAASLDAVTNTGINVEIKTCFKEKQIPVCKAYRDQVQLQMEVADLELTHLVQQYINIQGKPLVVNVIKRDRDWFSKNEPIFKKFIEDLKEYSPFDIVLVNYQMSKFNEYSFIELKHMDDFSFDDEFLYTGSNFVMDRFN